MDENNTTSYLQNSVRLCGSSWSTCGYCRGDRSSIVNRDPSESSKAYSILADSMTPVVYESLICQGWRRSGRALYRPDNWVSCCPALTIRLRVQDFVPTKSQRKLQKQANKLFQATCMQTVNDQRTNVKNNHAHNNNLELNMKELQKSGFMNDLREWTTRILTSLVNETSLLDQPVSFKILPRRKHDGCDPSKVTLATSICAAIAGRSKGTIDRTELATRVADELRRRHTVASSSNSYVDTPHLEADCNGANGSHANHSIALKKHKPCGCNVQILSVQAHEASGQVLVTVQIAGANDDAATASVHTKQNLDATRDNNEQDDQCSNKLTTWWNRQHLLDNDNSPVASLGLEVTTLPAYESALMPEVHKLYLLYQHEIHQDANPYAEDSAALGASDCTYEWAENAPQGWAERAKSMLLDLYKDSPQFDRITEAYGHFVGFLVDNPFETHSASTTLNGSQLGTYHQHYRVNGLLVAVGVVDILPGGLSSVYLFYDPSFAHDVLPLGKFAILKEIEWTNDKKLPYYYLGYYIDSCPKMRYKADYHLSELLCPETRQWVAADQARAMIAEKSPIHNCCQVYLDTDVNEVNNGVVTPSQIKLEVGMGQPATMNMLHARGQELIRPLLNEFVAEAGSNVAPFCTIKLV
ncbi:hypothetical protein MPSEU_000453100 [Mayamaea pseudoterrestris]|nr:hypothetical protein MPSEU_000453100 [Mayamaea pseudoterrestris]